MKMENKSVIKMWQEYRDRFGDVANKYEAWAFGNSMEMADELANLVLAGVKTATSSLYLFYELENETLPYVGLHNIILNGKGEAVAIIETTSVQITPYDEVTEEHAYLEGEGDRSLAYWQKVHEDFFKKELREINRDFTEDMLVVCEKFKLVYKNGEIC
ncbi:MULTISPECIES: ASCH domain-containing protein [unclassified Oceanobacillus]|uniref:ASCH domain-containing protein n=1 Tax=unclassified Oceanobacillus TaxID=2630292 RepID=UPI003FA5AB49